MELLRALVLIFSTTVHVYNCIYYARAAGVCRSCSSYVLFFILLLAVAPVGGTAHDVVLL